VGFEVAADSYDRFMGRYSALLATRFADFAGVGAGQRALDVGCGPGALTAELVGRLGVERVTAADPSQSFVAAARERHPGVEVVSAAAEDLPFADDAFDLALAQLVVHFMADPVAGLREMARVARPGGTVAACVWDHAGGRTPIGVFWRVVRERDPGAHDESELNGARAGHLAALFGEAGLDGIEEAELAVTVNHPSFEDWWQPLTLGVGPAGAYVAALDAGERADLRERLRRALGDGPFDITGTVWAVRAAAIS
jgi:SAM-dependent methyltransferase